MSGNIIMSAAGAAILWAGAFSAFGMASRPMSKSFEYNVEDLKRVDPSLLSHEQAEAVALKIKDPQAIALDRSGVLYVAGAGRIAVLREGREERSMDLPFDAAALAVEEDGSLLAAGGNQAVRCRADGKHEPLAQFPSNAVLVSVAACRDAIYAADAENKVVWRVSSGGQLSSFDRVVDGPRSERFLVPSPHMPLAAGVDGSLWAVNPGRHRVLNLRPGGELIAAWGAPSMQPEGFCGCCNPTHLIVLPDGSFLTSEKGLPRVKIHGPDGRLVSVVADGRHLKDDRGYLSLAAGADGRIYVLDRQAGVVRVFKRREAPGGP